MDSRSLPTTGATPDARLAFAPNRQRFTLVDVKVDTIDRLHITVGGRESDRQAFIDQRARRCRRFLNAQTKKADDTFENDDIGHRKRGTNDEDTQQAGRDVLCRRRLTRRKDDLFSGGLLHAQDMAQYRNLNEGL